jgi:octanoyl-[GcvH]:protein N-octanoyltransferase
VRRLNVICDAFPDDPALDVAVSRALLERVAAREVPDSLRLGRPSAWVAFGKRDALAAGYAEAVRSAREAGFGAALRLAGGRAAVFHEGTVAIAHAIADEDPRSRVHDRFRWVADAVASALRDLGVDARAGEVQGEYCPGGYSVNAGGQTKLAGVGQRLIRGAAHLGGVVVAEGAERVRDALVPVYAELGLDWDPQTAGSVADEAPGVGFGEVAAALRAEYERRYELVETKLDEETLALARRLAPQHRPPVERPTGR